MAVNPIERHTHNGVDAPRIEYQDLTGKPVGLNNAPLATVSDPSGGLTQDSEARSAINDLIDRLQDLGLIQ